MVSRGSTQPPASRADGDPMDLSEQAHNQEPVPCTLPEGSVCRAIDYEKLPQSFHTGEYDLLAGVHNFWIASGRRMTGCAWSCSPIGAQLLQGTSSSPSSISTPTSAITANALLREASTSSSYKRISTPLRHHNHPSTR